MKFDSGISEPTVRKAVSELKAMRGKVANLDAMVDRIAPRALAHVVEEALMAESAGVGLWRYSGTDLEIIKGAILRLNSWCARGRPPAGTRPT